MNEEKLRKSFEVWASEPPYELDVDRFPQDESKYAWPGQYRNPSVQLAWEAWREAAKTAPSSIGFSGVKD